MVLVVLLVMETALFVQAFVEIAADKMKQLIEALANGVPLISGRVRCHLLEEKALGSPVRTHAHCLH